LPGLDRAEAARRLGDKTRVEIILRHNLTQAQKQAVHDLGLAGLEFRETPRRVYPNGKLAGHALGFVDREQNGKAGLERALERDLRENADAPLKTSLDIRLQYAMEQELADAAWRAKAKAGAGVMLDARTGEVLALASWPQVDPGEPGEASPHAQFNRAAQVFEMGSTLKPFTVAMGLNENAVRLDERFDLTRTLMIEGQPIRDPHPYGARATLHDALAHSSNIAMADIALRLGAEKQRAYLEKLGLTGRVPLEMPEIEAAQIRTQRDALTTAILGYGHAMSVNLIQAAGAYTVFANDGARLAITMRKRESGDPIVRTPVFSEIAARETLLLMRAVVEEGTGRDANIAHLGLAGKTGTAEIYDRAAGRYDRDRMVSSFIAVFPYDAPRYILALALIEPQRTAENDNLATGGATAAPAVGRLAARVAPFIGLGVAPNRAANGDQPQ
jgi:cell division protein FtsI (penicillin-binding protein 3)